ncbi:GPI mannosyltransferase 1, partial [Ascosphaera pollenicola]
MVLYSDDSRLGAGLVGGGWVGYHQNQLVPSLTGHAALGDTAEVPDAEAVAALGALLTARDSPLLQCASAVYICLDNLHTVFTASDGLASQFVRSA